MSLPSAEIADAGPERRNPMGWVVFGLLAAFMVLLQLVSYLDRTPSAARTRSRVELELERELGSSDDSPAAKARRAEALDEAERQLEPSLAGDPATSLLYAAIRTEQKKALRAPELLAIKSGKEPIYAAAYRAYTAPAPGPDEARALAAKIPRGTFTGRLVAVQTLEKAKLDGGRAKLAESEPLVEAGLAALLGLLGLGLLFGYAAARAAGLLPPKGLILGDVSAFDADRLAHRASQILSSYLALGLVGAMILRGFSDSGAAQTASSLAIIVIIVLLARTPIHGKLISLKAIGISGENLGIHVGWGVAGAIANLPIAYLLLVVGSQVFRGLPAPEHPSTIQLSEASSPWVVLQLTFAACVAAPFIEEIMFRGTLFPALASVLRSPIWAGVISSVVFAAIHPTGIPVWPALAAVGGMSCFLSYQTRSLVPSMVMHATHNLLQVVLILLLAR